MSQKQKVKRLLKLADFVEKLPKKQFNMGLIAEQHRCGTVGCLMGWAGMMPAFRRLGFKTEFPKFDKEELTTSFAYIENHRCGFSDISDTFDSASELFGLSQNESLELFGAGDSDFIPQSSPTPKQAAKGLRNFVTFKLEQLDTLAGLEESIA